MKSLKNLVLTITLLSSANFAFADWVPYNICEPPAEDAAAAIYDLCKQLGKSNQECREEAQRTYDAVFKACISNLIKLNRPQIGW